MDADRHMEGYVAPGFEAVADCFRARLADEGELGAAFAAVAEGRPVVDLWGGTADRRTGRPWERDTLVLVFSGTKGFVALTLLMLMDRGLLDLDSPVARYWPEFGARGKRSVLVRHVVSHTAGLPGIREPVSYEDVTNDLHMADLLARQAPLSEPGAQLRYHRLTYGWLCGELVRRIDGRSIGRFFADEVARPLELELWLGLPAELESRVATLEYGPGWGMRKLDEEAVARDALLAAVWENPPIFPDDHLPWNASAWHQAEIPGANAIGTARSIARLYGAVARGGELDGIRLLSEPTLRLGTRCLAREREPFTGDPSAYGVGFELQTELMPFGSPSRAFGHTGAGGSVHGAWPEEQIGFSYTMNLLRDDQAVDPRSRSLLTALHRAARSTKGAAAKAAG